MVKQTARNPAEAHAEMIDLMRQQENDRIAREAKSQRRKLNEFLVMAAVQGYISKYGNDISKDEVIAHSIEYADLITARIDGR